MKKIYFVRHGSTDGNESGAYQFPDHPLSEHGLRQGDSVAVRFKEVPIDLVVASDMTRASQTAEKIAEVLGLEVRHSELFREIMRPSIVRGKTKADPAVAKIMSEIKDRFGEKDWHHSDEDNFYDLRDRAVKSLKYLESLQEKNILVVTHGYILRMIISVMSLGPEVSAADFLKLNHFYITKNTGITVVEEDRGSYFLLTWNDHAHLGDLDDPKRSDL